MVPLICPTCQNVFAGKASMPAPPCYFAWGCFRYFSWEREPRRPCFCLSRDDRRVACRAVARAQRGPPSLDGPWPGSLRYDMACPADTVLYWRWGQPAVNHSQRNSPVIWLKIRKLSRETRASDVFFNHFRQLSERATESVSVKNRLITGGEQARNRLEAGVHQGAKYLPACIVFPSFFRRPAHRGFEVVVDRL